MSVEREILEYLADARGKHFSRYKGVRVGFLGLPDFKHYKYQTLANKSSILLKKGFVRKTATGEFFITSQGLDFLDGEREILEKFETDKQKNSPKDLLVVYDIPEDRKKERDWFRFHLKKFHFVMIQRSVWVGPSPLPKEFLDYIKKIRLKDSIKTFKLAKPYAEK